jgi:transcriptional regulator with XRE-family HTH domain
MYEELIAKRLAHLRTAKGVSAREMSLDIGQNSSYINRIENGKSMPSMQGFIYICEYLGVTPSEFFASDTPMNSEALVLAKELENLSKEELQLVKNLISSLKNLNK